MHWESEICKKGWEKRRSESCRSYLARFIVRSAEFLNKDDQSSCQLHTFSFNKKNKMSTLKEMDYGTKCCLFPGFYSWEQPLKMSAAKWSFRDYSNWPLWVIQHLTLLLHFIGCQWPWWRTLRGGRTGGTRLATMPWRQKQWKKWLLAVSRCSKLKNLYWSLQIFYLLKMKIFILKGSKTKLTHF